MLADLSVWAPLPESVRLWIDGETRPMRRGAGGWWHPVTRGPFRAGSRYGYLLDDSDRVVADPRSFSQPDGVHGTSMIVDLDAFSWTDLDWPGRQLVGDELATSVMYELHVGTFTPGGTLDDAIDRLGHLVDLGVDFVELLPVNAFSGPHNWGYDGVLWFAVDESYGGPLAYQRFVDACHRVGLAVVQDVVYNHLGPSGNYLGEFGPYLRPDRSNSWGGALDFDQTAVRRHVIDNAMMWFRDMHVDALRLDAVHALVDHRDTHILQDLSRERTSLEEQIGRPLALIAESDLNDPDMITPLAAGGFGMDAQWNDDFHHALHAALTGETNGYYADFEHLDALEKVMLGGFFHDGTWSSFRGRHHGRPIDTDVISSSRLIGYSQNHDQVGNRAAGDRLSATSNERRLAIAAVMTLTSPFTPMLFMGEEWGASSPWQYFTAHDEPELARSISRGRLEEFAAMGWDPEIVPDPQHPATFLRSKLRWEEMAEAGHRRILELYTALIRARRTHPEVSSPGFARRVVRGSEWIVVHRNERCTVAANFGTDDVVVDSGLDPSFELRISTADGCGIEPGILTIPGESAMILVGQPTPPAADR
jgi:maltooligosyltrehalose trehalohydrolase